jgi:hypothetical protein
MNISFEAFKSYFIGPILNRTYLDLQNVTKRKALNCQDCIGNGLTLWRKKVTLVGNYSIRDLRTVEFGSQNFNVCNYVFNGEGSYNESVEINIMFDFLKNIDFSGTSINITNYLKNCFFL